jgi:hypothetical protein
MMLAQHRSHVFSTCTTALQHLEEISQAVTVGNSPSGAKLTPLPEPGRQRLLEALDLIRDGLSDMMHSFASEAAAASAEPAGPSATLMWVNILLRTVEELVGDLAPPRMGRRYGSLGRAEAERLQGQVDATITAVHAAMQLSERIVR